MATTNLNVRVDENLKKTADTLLNELGLNMSTAINIYLKQIVRENGIPFEIKLDKPNAETLQAMQDVREGKNLHGPFNSLRSDFQCFPGTDEDIFPYYRPEESVIPLS